MKEIKKLTLERIKTHTQQQCLKSKTLSIARRLTLTKFVLSALPLYIMQFEFLTKMVCDKFD